MLLAAVAAGVMVYKWPPGRALIDRWALRTPVLGKVLRLAGTVTFASSLGVMLRSGITVLEALRTVEGLHANTHLASRVAAARDAVMEGGDLARPLAEKQAYMPMLSSMVAVGENTGQLDEVLERVTVFHEAQLKAAIKKLSALIEPLTIVVVGGIVGYVYLAFFMALFAAGG
jgi:type IV pilus assembly protein PilC